MSRGLCRRFQFLWLLWSTSKGWGKRWLRGNPPLKYWPKMLVPGNLSDWFILQKKLQLIWFQDWWWQSILFLLFLICSIFFSVLLDNVQAHSRIHSDVHWFISLCWLKSYSVKNITYATLELQMVQLQISAVCIFFNQALTCYNCESHYLKGGEHCFLKRGWERPLPGFLWFAPQSTEYGAVVSMDTRLKICEDDLFSSTPALWIFIKYYKVR